MSTFKPSDLVAMDFLAINKVIDDPTATFGLMALCRHLAESGDSWETDVPLSVLTEAANTHPFSNEVVEHFASQGSFWTVMTDDDGLVFKPSAVAWLAERLAPPVADDTVPDAHVAHYPPAHPAGCMCTKCQEEARPKS